MKRTFLASLLLASAALFAEDKDFELFALVDSLDFETFFDIETPMGTVKTLEHVLRAYPTTVLWRDKGGGLMRYSSAEEWSEYAENPLDKRQIWRRSVYGDLRQHNRATNVFQLVRAECDRRKVGFGIHTTWEENHWLAGTESNWTMAHPGLTSRARLGPVRLASGSLSYPEYLEHKLALVDERLAMRPQVIFLDLFRCGGWSPLFEYVEPVIRRWRDLYQCDPPQNGRLDPRWTRLVSEYTHGYLRQFGAKCRAKGARFLLGLSSFSKDNDYCWEERAIDWRALARDGVIDGVVIMGTQLDESRPFESTAENLAFAKEGCGPAKLYFQVSTYVMNTGVATYATAAGLTLPEAARRMIEVAKEAGCSGAILECVDYNNYPDAICDELAAVSSTVQGPLHRWTGGAAGDWSAAENWTGEIAPNGPTNAVEVRRSSTLTLAGGAVTDISHLIVRNPGSRVTLAAGEGGSLRLNMGGGRIADDQNGITVGAGATLTVAAPVTMNGRFDRWGYGEMVIAAEMAADPSGANFVLSSFGTNTIVRGGGLRSDAGTILVGNGQGEEARGCLRIEDDGFIEARSLNLSGGVGCAANTLVQEGADSSVRVRTLTVNGASQASRQEYVLRGGSVSADTLSTSSASATAGGGFRQEGGASAFGTVKVVYGDVRLTGGTMTVSGSIARSGGDGSFAAEGGTLVLGAGATVSVPVVVSNATLVLSGEVSFSGEGRFVFAGDSTVSLGSDAAFDGDRLQALPGARLRLAADAPRKLTMRTDSTLPDALEIGGNVTVWIPLGVQLSARSATPPAVSIGSGGHLELAGQTARIATPIDLAIESGGQLWVDAQGGKYARTMVVAHRYSVDGVDQPVGACNARNDASAAFRGNATSTLQVPWTWTGRGDGRSWDDAANWENAAVPTASSSCVADLSRATGAVLLGTAVDLGGIAYLPVAEGSTLTLGTAADGAVLRLFAQGGGYRPAAICRRGCRIDFDVDFANGNGGDIATWNGGGTYRFLRSVASGLDRYFTVDGAVEFAGAASGANLSYFSNHDSDSKVRILPGAEISVSGTVTTEVSGFICGRGYEQDGGAVAAKTLCLSVGRPDGRNHADYALNGGTLTLSDALILGGTNPLNVNKGGMYDTGSFTMTGGELRVPRMTTELNSNWYRLSGGEIWLGSGGFARTDSPRAATVANTTPGLEFGGVTFHAAADWTSAADLEIALTGTGGDTAFDLEEGRTVTLAGAVSGRGGLVKRGDGALVVAGAYSATGTVRAESGRLVLAAGSTFAGPEMLDVRGARLELLGTVDGGNLLLSASALSDLTADGDVTVGALALGGTMQTPGTYPVNGGRVIVAPPEGTPAWVGANGGRWSESGNWANAAPPGEAATLDFLYSPLPADALIVVDAPVTLAGLAYRSAHDAGRLVLRGAGSGALTLADGAEILVPEGLTLEIECEVRTEGRVIKRGKGVVAFLGRVRSARPPEDLVFGEGSAVKVEQGEAAFAGEVEGVHVYPCSSVREDDPLVTIREGAVFANRALVTAAWNARSETTYGRVVQDGGTVDIGLATIDLFGSTGIQNGAGGSFAHANKHCFAWFSAGETSYTLNGGTYSVAAEDMIVCMNLNNTNAGGGRTTVTVNGGRMAFGTTVFFSTQNAEHDAVVLNGGELSVKSLAAGSGSGDACIRELILNGGVFTGGPDAVGAGFGVSANGKVELRQPGAGDSFTLPSCTAGRGRLVQTGPGALLVGPTDFAGDFAVTGGMLRLLDGADLSAVSLDVRTLDDVTVAGGREAAVRRLYLNGVSAATGLYPAAEGTLRVLKDVREEIAEATDAPDLDWFVAGDREWSAVWGADAADGADAVRSGPVAHGEESVLGVRFYGKGTFAFDWRVSSEEKYDAVHLEVDGTIVRHISGEAGWQRVTLDLGPGDHEVRWIYRKNRTVSAGADAAWVDRVSWTVAPEPTLAEALNKGCELEWRTGGDLGWEAFHTSAAYEGGSCAVSGAIGDLGVSWIETTVTGPGRLEFVWAVSCERYDWCEFTVDGELDAEMSGETDWIARTLDLGEGEHVVRWEYWKDAMDDPDETGADCALLDYVRFTPERDVIDTDFGTVEVSAFYAWLRDNRRVEEPSVPLTRTARRTLAAAKAVSLDAKGEPLVADYVAGTSPDDADSRLVAQIDMVDGQPVVSWDPALNGTNESGRCEKKGVRTYTLWGSNDLGDPQGWAEVPNGEEGRYRFFKVSVALP